MFAVIRKSYLYLESLKNAPFYYIEWSFDSVSSDKISLARKTVKKDVRLLE